MNGEADALVASLNAQREHVLGVVGELPEDALRAAALPSGWTPLGLVQHLALEVAWPDFFEGFPAQPLRRTILHVIAETATHAGHLDAFRELTDGVQWLVLTQ